MSLVLDLKPDIEERLRRAAAQEGVPAEQYAAHLLEEQVSTAAETKRQAAIALLRQWREQGDADEQRETGEFLLKALDEDRLSYRKLFP